MRSEIIWIIVGMAIVTYLTRFGCLFLFRHTGIPPFIEGWLRHIPTAVLTALILPSLLLPKGQLDFSPQNHYLLAGLVASFIAYKSRNIMATVGLGIMVMMSLHWLEKMNLLPF